MCVWGWGRVTRYQHIVGGSFIMPVRIRHFVPSIVPFTSQKCSIGLGPGEFGGRVKAFVGFLQLVNSVYGVSKCIIQLQRNGGIALRTRSASASNLSHSTPERRRGGCDGCVCLLHIGSGSSGGPGDACLSSHVCRRTEVAANADGCHQTQRKPGAANTPA